VIAVLPEGHELLIDGEHVRAQGHGHAIVASRSHEDEWHSVEWDEEALDWVCTCMGYTVRHKCRHSRAISRYAGGEADVRVFKEDE
jgi:hypothetical protein